jgi:hypothetical protein
LSQELFKQRAHLLYGQVWLAFTPGNNIDIGGKLRQGVSSHE